MSDTKTDEPITPMNRPAPHPGPYLPAAEAARHVGISVSTLWRYLRDDPTFPRPFKPTERKTLFATPEMDEWMSSKRVPREQPTT